MIRSGKSLGVTSHLVIDDSDGEGNYYPPCFLLWDVNSELGVQNEQSLNEQYGNYGGKVSTYAIRGRRDLALLRQEIHHLAATVEFFFSHTMEDLCQKIFICRT